MILPSCGRRIVPFALLLAVLSITATLWGSRRFERAALGAETIFVSVGAYRDVECAATLVDLFRRARHPAAVFVGIVTYAASETTTTTTNTTNAAVLHGDNTDNAVGGVAGSQSSSAGERCESPELAPFEQNIRRLPLGIADARGPSLSRYKATTLYGGEKYLLQIDSHMRFATGWDAELVRMIQSAPRRNSVLTHYPPSWDDPSEARVPAMCRARWVPEAAGAEVLMFEAVLVAAPPRSGDLRPVPFAAAGFMFAPAHVLREVPFDPSLDYLFHGEEALYSARLWTSGWDILTPDRNVAFHHYGRQAAPKFWNDFDSDVSYHSKKAAVLRKVEALMMSEHGPGIKYGMGKVRSVRQWWQYTGLDPANRALVADGERFCGARVL